jgi:hypothetical protein
MLKRTALFILLAATATLRAQDPVPAMEPICKGDQPTPVPAGKMRVHGLIQAPPIDIPEPSSSGR